MIDTGLCANAKIIATESEAGQKDAGGNCEDGGEQVNAPKRPLSPFIFFSQEARREIKKDNPSLNSKQVMKIVQRNWRQLTEE